LSLAGPGQHAGQEDKPPYRPSRGYQRDRQPAEGMAHHDKVITSTCERLQRGGRVLGGTCPGILAGKIHREHLMASLFKLRGERLPAP